MLKAKAEQVALKAKAQTLELKHALDMEEQLKAKKERYDVEAEVAAAEAKVHVFSRGVWYHRLHMNNHFPRSSILWQLQASK